MQWTKGTNSNGDSDYSNEKTWKPTGEETIQGTLVSKKSVKGQDGEMVTILKLEDSDDVIWNIWCSRKVLKDLVAEYDEQIIPGRIIGIMCEGEKKVEGTTRTYFDYQIGFADADDVKASKTKVGAEEPF